MVMVYILLFVAIVDQELQYYQIGNSYANQVDCNKERMKASALLRNGAGLFCVEVNRSS